MRYTSIAAAAVVTLLSPFAICPAQANPNPAANFGCSGRCFGLFKSIHQHGPLYNYGPYSGYYPFAPYGPWNEYLQYDPMFYGDPSTTAYGTWSNGTGNMYGKNQNVFRHHHHYREQHIPVSFHSSRQPLFNSNDFFHASWIQGGWYRGHTWLHNGSGTSGEFKAPECGLDCGIATAMPTDPTGDPTCRYTGCGTPSQSVPFYNATPTLNPALPLLPCKSCR